MDLDACQDMAVGLVKELIRNPSVSREEKRAADLMEEVLQKHDLTVRRKHHNVWTEHRVSDDKPNILLNSHLDTVKPVDGWKRDPFVPQVEGNRIYGLGSNDAGGPLVSLLACFLNNAGRQDLPYNLIFAATAEEEISGDIGVACILNDLGKIDLGIIGEPTMNQMAVAEKGLMVIDGMGLGSSAHAATGKGINAIYEAMKDIDWISGYQFEKTSEWLGAVSMQVTMISSGTQHNVVPDQCSWVADIRTNEHYSNEAVFEVIKQNLNGEVRARSFRLNPSFISGEHPVVMRGTDMGLKSYGSLTLSDQALMSFPTLKMGPGDSSRSHTADEYICVDEIRQGISYYIQLLEGLQI
ncbi:MAG: acetylornithine deacetylase [Bacteroides sp. SM23_62]|nr:MAG: acetylornithine deacetylase [Bacteroides sp. SM23_62]